MCVKEIGIDIIESERFRRFKDDRNHPFIKKNFSLGEIKYCFGFRDPSPHLAGIFAAKEAVCKALGGLKIYLPNIEIRHSREGAPKIYRKRKKLTCMLISITHTQSVALAVAVKI